MFKGFLLFFLPFSFVLGEVKVQTGLDRFFKEGYYKELKGKRVGLITNHTGISSSYQSTVALFLIHSQEYAVTAIFTPEHGLDGSAYAAEKTKNGLFKGKIPLYSLHGETKRPTKEMLKDVDILIYDIQDIGARSYTYATTLYYILEEAAKSNIAVLVLDRPNPINGTIVDGPMLNDTQRSFIGYINVPYCHGMTIGELACFFNEEYRVGCNLRVIELRGWNREMTFSDTGLPWVPTSPHIPESDTPLYCLTTGILGELGIVNIGVGYTLPFKVVGAPWIDGEQFASKLNEQHLPGVHFLPFHYRPFYGSLKGTDCHGVKICITDLSEYKPLTVQYFLIGLLKSLYPEKVLSQLAALSDSSKNLFNKANGNDVMIKYISEERYISWKLVDYQKTERTTFLKKRKNHLLY
jgi:uncharacterized protein YbbC (DUF1343 family)